MKNIKISIVIVALTVFAIACGQSANTATPNTAQTNANKAASPAPSATAAAKDEAAIAADLYTVNCMTCHKDSGKGGPVTVEGKKLDPDDLTADKMKGKSDEKLKGYIIDGAPDDGMPAFKDKLTEAQIVSLVKHIRVLQGK